MIPWARPPGVSPVRQAHERGAGLVSLLFYFMHGEEMGDYLQGVGPYALCPFQEALSMICQVSAVFFRHVFRGVDGLQRTSPPWVGGDAQTLTEDFDALVCASDLDLFSDVFVGDLNICNPLLL